jgi:LruC domain-containing protein
MSNPWLSRGESESSYLPPDVVNDTARSFAEPFEFETLLPVSLNLTIDFYEAGQTLQEIVPEAGKAVVVLTDTQGNLVYEGGVQADGSINAQLALPAAPEDMILTIKAEGYTDRSVTISDIVNYSEINRTMGLMSEGITAKGQDLTDSDGDLVPDLYDAYPFDPEVAFTVRVPDEESLTVAFEDLYLRARAGDADYNDFLAQYTITEHYNGQNQLTKITGEATAKVKIAGYNHMFGITIGYDRAVEDILEVAIEATYYDKNGVKVEDASIPPVENITIPANSTYKNKAIVPLFESTKDAIGKTAKFVVTFEPAIDRSKVEAAPFDPFIYVKNTGYDIHLIGKDPVPGTKNPVSSYTTAAFNFMDEAGFPWALLVPADWQHPAETQFIEELYPYFKFWRDEDGAKFSNWYLLPLDPTSNNPPYPVSGSDPNPAYTANQADKLLFYYLNIETIDKKQDPDGDEVFFRSSALPDYMSLDESSGIITIDNALPGEVVAYFWSEDVHGASTETNPFKVIFTFVEVTERQRLIIETYPFLLGAPATDTTLELYDASGLLVWDENNPGVPFDHFPSAMIDYLPAVDLVSGTVLFAKIFSASGNIGPYSIRAFYLGETALLPGGLPPYVYSGFTTNDPDLPYEDFEFNLDVDPWNDTYVDVDPWDDIYTPGEGPFIIPFDSASPLHRSLETPDDVDWIRIIVP